MNDEIKGKVIVIILCCIECCISISILLSRLGTQLSNPVRDIIRILLAIGLFICIYKGMNWSRILTAVLMCVSALMLVYGIVQYIGLYEQYKHLSMQIMIIKNSVYLIYYCAAAGILFASKSVRALSNK